MKVHLDDRDEPVEVGSDQVEIEDDDPLIPEGEVDERMDKRIGRAKREHKKSLKDDDEFFRSLAEARGLEFDEEGALQTGVDDERFQEVKKKASRVDELEEELEEANKKIQRGRETDLENKLLQVSDGIREDMKDVFLTYGKQRFTYDDEYGWVATDEDGDVAFKGGKPKGPEAVVNEMRETKPGFFKSTEMNGGPSDDPTDETSGTPESITRAEFEELSQARRKDLVDEGVQIVNE
jgi:vacuolar-type H+-ATPase subunit I/STV1